MRWLIRLMNQRKPRNAISLNLQVLVRNYMTVQMHRNILIKYAANGIKAGTHKSSRAPHQSHSLLETGASSCPVTRFAMGFPRLYSARSVAPISPFFPHAHGAALDIA